MVDLRRSFISQRTGKYKAGNGQWSLRGVGLSRSYLGNAMTEQKKESGKSHVKRSWEKVNNDDGFEMLPSFPS